MKPWPEFNFKFKISSGNLIKVKERCFFLWLIIFLVSNISCLVSYFSLYWGRGVHTKNW